MSGKEFIITAISSSPEVRQSPEQGQTFPMRKKNKHCIVDKFDEEKKKKLNERKKNK